MILEFCVAALFLLILLILVFLILRNKPFVHRKKTVNQNTTLTIVANSNLHKVTVEAEFGRDSITFERRRIRKGQSIEFTYPASEKPAKVTVEVQPDKPKVYSI